MSEFTFEIGNRLFWLVLIFGMLFLSERAFWIWKNIIKKVRLTETDYIDHQLKKRSRGVEREP